MMLLALGQRKHFARGEALPRQCAKEFEHCYFRECCGEDDGDLTCIQGGRAAVYYVNKNSTCYSDRSLALAKKSDSEKLNLLHYFFETLVPRQEQKSSRQIKKLFQDHQHEFPQLVKRMEHRYKVSFVGPEESYDMEL